MAATAPVWHFFVDRGGTFTDVIGLASSGKLHSRKLLSQQAGSRDATTLAIAELLNQHAAVEGRSVGSVRIGTTVATNALLEGKGTPTALLVTSGFRDQFEIGYQNRPKLFDLNIRLPKPLYQSVVEVKERVSAQGEVLQTLDLVHAETELCKLLAQGTRAIAIVLLHAYRFPAHEQALTNLAQRLGFTQVSASHEVSPLLRLVPRGQTTIADACLTPVVQEYVTHVESELRALGIKAALNFMKSNGELSPARAFRGRDAVLSGPAGGIIAMAHSGLEAGFQRLIGFDMGGTSADVSHFSGNDISECERRSETSIAGLRLSSPTLALHTIASGGGSVLQFDAERFRVGPTSAGALPGPACYGRGGPLTVTDCNVMLGRIQPQFFPHVFGPHGDAAIDSAATARAFDTLTANINSACNTSLSRESVAEGFLQVAVANMANAVKVVSSQQGYDLRDYTLVSFGGAAGQHVCELAQELGVKSVLIPPLASLLSARGMGLARLGATRTANLDVALEGASELLEHTVQRCSADALHELRQNAVDVERTVQRATASLKLRNTNHSLDVTVSTLDDMWRQFSVQYVQRFRRTPARSDIILDSVRVEVSTELPGVPPSSDPESLSRIGTGIEPVARAVAYVAGAWQDLPIYERKTLAVGSRVRGPLLLVERDSVLYLAACWQAEVTPAFAILLKQEATTLTPHESQQLNGPDPVLLEVFHGLLMNIAEQMGAQLAQSAVSVNIRERLDFSCAIFDAHGQLVANAPHVPVHLGSMSATVQDIVQRCAPLRPGDVFISNDPFNGGTHLPDITVVTPVFVTNGPTPAFFVAARGHHADVGGIEPGSMPAASQSIEDEGVVFQNLKWFDAGTEQREAVFEVLRGGLHPARNPDQNIADLLAQLGACETGKTELLACVERYGLELVTRYLSFIQDNAESCVAQAISALKDGTFITRMDCGAEIHVRLSVNQQTKRAHIDFSGTSAQVESNFNCPTAVVHAAVLYVFRCLVADDIPLNAGCFRPLTLNIPEGSLLSPRYPAATVAGNVETSQAVVDTLFGVIGSVAASQGTMNNVTLGSDLYQYYETIGGGSGAGPGFHGTAAVQTHMTNSRITDPEVLELRYPVRVEEHSIRRGSGGNGQFRGGDGATRRLRMLEPMSVSLLSNRRRSAPYGSAGGSAGECGSAWIEQGDGTRRVLDYAETVRLNAGDALCVNTPSGGGYGTTQSPPMPISDGVSARSGS